MLAARAIVPKGPLPRPYENKAVETLDKAGARYSIW
jgi:hypothetical protein